MLNNPSHQYFNQKSGKTLHGKSAYSKLAKPFKSPSRLLKNSQTGTIHSDANSSGYGKQKLQIIRENNNPNREINASKMKSFVTNPSSKLVTGIGSPGEEGNFQEVHV